MSEPQYYEDDDFQTQQQTDQQDQFRQLREKAKRTTKAEAEAERLRRENAFLKAGIDTEDPKAKYFYKGYDGDLERDAIRAAAAEIGLAEPITRTEIPEAELEALRRIQGQTPETATPPGVTYEDFAAMSRSDQIRFLTSHPDAQRSWEAGRPHPA